MTYEILAPELDGSIARVRLDRPANLDAPALQEIVAVA